MGKVFLNWWAVESDKVTMLIVLAILLLLPFSKAVPLKGKYIQLLLLAIYTGGLFY